MTNEQPGREPANKCIPLGPARHIHNNLISEEAILGNFYAMAANLLQAINAREPGMQFATPQEADVLYKLSRCIAILKNIRRPRTAPPATGHWTNLTKSFKTGRY